VPLNKESNQRVDIFSDTETGAALEQKVSTKFNWKSLRFFIITLTCLLIIGLGSWALLLESSGKRKLPTPRRQSYNL
jgi:hypothetical protein